MTNDGLNDAGSKYLNWIKQNTQIQNNTITLREHPNLFVGAPYYGISVNNLLEGSSNGNFIKSNTVNGFYTPTSDPNTSNNPNLTGIVSSISGRILVTCNNTSNTVRGIGFSGGNQQSLFKNNKMQNHRYGFFLDQNGVIGQQVRQR